MIEAQGRLDSQNGCRDERWRQWRRADDFMGAGRQRRRNSAGVCWNRHPSEILGNQLGIRIQTLGERLLLMRAAGTVLVLRRFSAMAVTMAGGVMRVMRRR